MDDEPIISHCLKSEREKQIPYIWENGTDEPICRAGIEMQMLRMDLWNTGREGMGELS